MNSKKKYMFLILLVLGVVSLAINGVSYAKYASNSIWNYYLKSKGFYIKSEELDVTSIKNINNMWDGGSTYFTINNSLNSSVVTEYDINYQVTCTIEGDMALTNECHTNGTNDSTFNGIISSYKACTNDTLDGVNVAGYNQSSCEMAGYTWKNQVATKELYFDIVNKDGNEVTDVNVNIAVTTTSPYKKVLNGKFILHKLYNDEGNVALIYKNHNDYDELVVSNSHEENKCVEVSWNADDLLIDVDTKKILSYSTDTNGYINKIKFDISKMDSLNYIFYKKQLGSTFDVTAFTLKELDECN